MTVIVAITTIKYKIIIIINIIIIIYYYYYYILLFLIFYNILLFLIFYNILLFLIFYNILLLLMTDLATSLHLVFLFPPGFVVYVVLAHLRRRKRGKTARKKDKTCHRPVGPVSRSIRYRLPPHR